MNYKIINNLTHGSLFSGIGGFELGAQYAGIDTLWSCEIEKFQREILKKHFPNTEVYEDIRKTTGLRYVDIISGGFPCQDISIAGKGKGIRGERSGLWSEMFRIIREVRPKYVVIENSPMLLVRGFERVLCDLSQIGYDAEWQCISNYSFGYPHERKRLYIIAYSYKIGRENVVLKYGKFESIFKKWTSEINLPNIISKRIYDLPTTKYLRNDYGLRYRAYRVGAIGNSVNPIVTHYLFECIKIFNNKLNGKEINI